MNSDEAGRRDGGYGRGFALARAALAGNPSDGYGGAVLAVTLPGWRAEAEATRAAGIGADPPNELVEATARRFCREVGGGPAQVSWRTSIPQRVGLGSSSALVIAVLRALCELCAVELGPTAMAELALAVEVEELGIVAGLQDRVVQSYGGLVFMEFGADARYEPLDAGLLPALVIAWRDDAAASSAACTSTSGNATAAPTPRSTRGWSSWPAQRDARARRYSPATASGSRRAWTGPSTLGRRCSSSTLAASRW